jgi:hypothetical protein
VYTAIHGPAENTLAFQPALALHLFGGVRVAVIVAFRDLLELRGVMFTLALGIERSVILP